MEKYTNFFYNIAMSLGRGYAECVYHEAICVLLREHSIKYSKEVPLSISFNNVVVGNVRADIIIPDENLVIECKAIEGNLKPAFISQTINYMKLLDYNNGILVNFNQNPTKESVEVVFIVKNGANYDCLQEGVVKTYTINGEVIC